MIGTVCVSDACYGQQAAYRISGTMFAFFMVMSVLTFFCKAAHLGAWAIKIIVYVGILGISLAIPNCEQRRRCVHLGPCTSPPPFTAFWAGYSKLALAGSIVFLLLQAFILVDFAYTMHEWLLRRIDAEDQRIGIEHGMDWEPGLLSNCWKVVYVLLSFSLLIASLAGLGAMFGVFSVCPLNQVDLLVALCVILCCVHFTLGSAVLPLGDARVGCHIHRT